MNPATSVESGRARLGALLAGLALWIGASIVVSSLAAPPLFEALEAWRPGGVPFVRLLRRLAQFVALAGLVLWMRRRGVRSLDAIGLGRPRERAGAIGLGLVAGALVVAAAFGFELAAGNRAASVEALSSARAAKAVAGAAAVGLFEEGVCRGALLFPFAPMGGATLAVANGAVSSVYAVAHFARGGARVDDVDAGSGFRVWGALPRAVADHVEAAVGLFLTGAVLYLYAARQGHAWGAVGIHAGAVLALQLLGTATEPVEGRDALFLVDGLLPGWGLSALLAAALVALAFAPRRSALRGSADQR